VYDNAQVSKYLTYPQNGSRSFKRENASVLWQPQLCIAWDTLAATYADCDGNGVVTSADHAVVATNYNKLHSDACKAPATPSIPSDEIDGNIVMKNHFSNSNKLLEEAIEQNYKIIPLNVANIDNQLTGIAGIINYAANPNVELINMSAGEFLGDNALVHFYDNRETKLASFCISIDRDKIPSMANNTVAYVYVRDNDNSVNNTNIRDFVG
jgi:ABC-type antimicrobial peptide transport system permease subunit